MNTWNGIYKRVSLRNIRYNETTGDSFKILFLVSNNPSQQELIF